MKRHTNQNLSVAIVKSVSVTLGFIAVLLLFLFSLYMYNSKGEFLSAFSLTYKFYLSAWVGILLTSLLYTPVSYGISFYFVRIKKGGGSFSDVFFLFKKPRLLIKAISLTSLQKLVIWFQRLIILILAFLVECAIFILCTILSGENIFDYQADFFKSVAEFITSNNFFIALTVIEWMIIVCVLFHIKLKYILCKYALICNPLLNVFEALRVSRFSIRGRQFCILKFYFKFLTAYSVAFISFGKINIKDNNSFSSFACDIVRNGMKRYFERTY